MSAPEAQADTRPNVYREGKKTIWRASAIGNCLASLAWEYNGETPQPPPEWLEESFTEGAKMEDTLIERLCDELDLTALEGAILIDKTGFAPGVNGQVELEVGWGPHIVRCHPDGIFEDGAGELFAGEVKFVGQGLWDQLHDITKVPRYAWQASIEMLTTGLPLAYGIGLKDRETRELIDFRCEIYEEPMFSLAEVKARVGKIVGMAKDPDDDLYCEYAMFPCGFWHMHTESDPMWQRDEVELAGDEAAIFEDILARREELLATERSTSDAKAKVNKEYRDFVEAHAIGAGVRVRTPNRLVTNVESPSTTTDWKKLCKDLEIPEEKIAEYKVPGRTSIFPKKVAST